jgi:hypothetical protein
VFFDDLSNLELWLDGFNILVNKPIQTESSASKKKLFESMIAYSRSSTIETKEVPPEPDNYDFPQ